MNRILVLAACLAIPLLCATASAQSVDEVINKNIEARGGLAKLKAVNTVRMTGTATVGSGIQSPIVIQFKRPGAIRMEFTVQGQALVQATDSKTPWTINPFAGSPSPTPMSAEDAKDITEEADIDGALVDYKAKGHTAELVGKEALDGTPVYKIKLTLKTGDVEFIYIDAATFLERKETTTRTQQGSSVMAESFPANYKAVDGVQFPFGIEVKANGQTVFKVVFDSIELNKPIDDAVFKMPAK